MPVRSTFNACDSDSFVYKHELGKLSPRHHHAVNMVHTTDVACGRVLHANRFINFCYGRLLNISSQVRHVPTIGKKNLLNNSISPTCSHNMVNFGPLAAEIGSLVWGTPANLNWFCVLPSLLQQRHLTEAKPSKLCMMFNHLLGCYSIYTYSGAVAP